MIRSIDKPIEQRNTGRGKPGAITHFDVELNTRQQKLLEQLPGYGSRATIKKQDASMTDLSALTARTGDEFAMFTREGNRLVIRGSHDTVPLTLEEAADLARQGYTWSGHTHPGNDRYCLFPSAGDRAILGAFNQHQSSIYNSVGQHFEFERE